MKVYGRSAGKVSSAANAGKRGQVVSPRVRLPTRRLTGTVADKVMRRSLKPGHVGSIPTGPTDKQALVVQRQGHRTPGTDAQRWSAATWVRVPPGALGSLTIRLPTLAPMM